MGLIFSVIKYFANAQYSCNVEFDLNTKRSTDPNIISAYNDVLGPIVNLTYHDSALILSAEKLFPTLLRYQYLYILYILYIYIHTVVHFVHTNNTKQTSWRNRYKYYIRS